MEHGTSTMSVTGHGRIGFRIRAFFEGLERRLVELGRGQVKTTAAILDFGGMNDDNIFTIVG